MDYNEILSDIEYIKLCVSQLNIKVNDDLLFENLEEIEKLLDACRKFVSRKIFEEEI